MTRAVFPGTFDPMTLGHLDVVRRSAALFDEVIVAISAAPRKNTLFSATERAELAAAQCADLPGARVETFDGLLVDFVRARGARVIVRSSRTITDFDYELQMALMNRALLPEVETLFITPEARFQHISSSMVREIALLGGDVSSCVAPVVLRALRARAAAAPQPPSQV